MKIKINENETYEIGINEEISVNELRELMSKVELLSGISTTPITPIASQKTKTTQKIRKKYTIAHDNLQDVKCISCGSKRLYKKGFAKEGARRLKCKNCGISFTVGDTSVKRKRKNHLKWKDRNEVINLLKIHYFGSDKERTKFAEIKGVDWKTLMKAISNLRKRFDILPQEIGLKEFPTVKGKRTSLYKLAETEPKKPTDDFKIPTPQPPLELKREEVEVGGEEIEKVKWWKPKS